ncbi:MAG TPA: hypothetical protein VFI03_02710 [Solirubrobacterales bacterium]|nr:hypothetical protein [Solirubrobacterales bacterium]
MAGILLRRVAGGWDSIGKGPLAIDQQLPPIPRYLTPPAQAVDPAMQAAEVRQMLEAKSERRRRRGEKPIDVEAEATRLLATADEVAETSARRDTALRTEVRQLVITRNERRMRRGQEPLDVEAETERQLADLIGSR